MEDGKGKGVLSGDRPVIGEDHLHKEGHDLPRAGEMACPVDAVLGQIWEKGPGGIFLEGPDGTLVDCNPAACRMFRYSREEMLGLGICDLVPGGVPPFPSERQDLTDTKGEISLNRQMLRSDRSLFPAKVNSHIVTVHEESFRLIYVCDVTEFREREKDLRYHAYTDGLTGIWNRYFFEMRLQEEMERVRRYGSSLSLIMFDLDRFKDFNDTFGHVCGDRALKRIAGRIQRNIRVSDCFARWGGDEFLLSTPVPELKAVTFAERLRREVGAAQWPRKSGISLSMGVMEFKGDIPIEILIDRVDRAMYRAKRSGGDRVCAWEGSLQD